MQRISIPVSFKAPRGCSPLYGRTVPIPSGISDILGDTKYFQITVGQVGDNYFEVLIDYQGVLETNGATMEYSERVVGPGDKMIRMRSRRYLRVSQSTPDEYGIDQFEISFWKSLS
jgi:hypothetical protein